MERTSSTTKVEETIAQQPPMVIEPICEDAPNNAMICPQGEGQSTRSDREQFERALMVEWQPYIDPYLGEQIQIKAQAEERQIWRFDNICSEEMTNHYKLEILHETGRNEHRSTFKYHEELEEQSLTKFGEPSEVKQICEARGDDPYILWDPGPKLMQHSETHGRGPYLNGKVTWKLLRCKEQQLCIELLRAKEVSDALVCLGHYNLQEDEFNQSCPQGKNIGHFMEQEYFISKLNLQDQLITSRMNQVQKPLQVQFVQTQLHEQIFQLHIWGQIGPLNHLGLIPFDPGIYANIHGWKTDRQQRLVAGGELKKMLIESHPSRQPKGIHWHDTSINQGSKGPKQAKAPKPELKEIICDDVNAFGAKEVKRPAITQSWREVHQICLSFFVLISIGFVLAFSHMDPKLNEDSTKHPSGWSRGNDEAHQPLSWGMDRVLVRTIRNFKEPFFETTHDGLGTDSIKVKGPTINSPDELLHKVNMKSTLKDNCTIRKKWILLTPDRQFKVIDELSREVDMPCNDLEDKVKLEGAGIDGTHSITQLALLSVFINGQNQRSNASLAQIFGIDKMDYMKAKEASGGPKDLTQEEGRPGHVFEFKIQNIIIQMEYKGQPLLLIKSENLGH